MLSNLISSYLKSNGVLKHNPEISEEFRAILKDNGFNEQNNSEIIEFMSVYGDEFSGTIGSISNLAEDLSYGNKSNDSYLKLENDIPDNYFQLFIPEYDDYLLYNNEDDSIILIEGGSDIRLKNKDYDKKWNSFNDFLEEFLGLK